MFYPAEPAASAARRSIACSPRPRGAAPTHARAQGADRPARRLHLLRPDRRAAPTRGSRRVAGVDQARRAARAGAPRGRRRPGAARRRRISPRRSASSRSMPTAAAIAAPPAAGRRAARRARRASIRSRCSCRSCSACSAISRWCRWSSAHAERRHVAEVLERALGRAGDADRRQLRPVALPSVRRGAGASTARPPTRSSALAPTLDHEQACGATPVNGLLLRGAPARPARRSCSTCAIPATPRATAGASSAMPHSAFAKEAPHGAH